LEAADPDLRVLDVGQVDVDVLPLRFRTESQQDVLFGELFFGQLALDLVFDVFEQIPLNADTVAMQLPRVEALDRAVRRVAVHLHLHLEIDARDIAEPYRRVLLPYEPDAVALLD